MGGDKSSFFLYKLTEVATNTNWLRNNEWDYAFVAKLPESEV